jgi:hypothetical protein
VTSPASSELDIQAARAPTIVRAAGGAVLGAGALVLLVVVQTFTGFGLSSRATVFLAVLALIAAGAVGAGVLLMRARAGSAVFGLVASIVLFLATCAWLFFSVAGGLLSAFGLLSPVVGLLGIGLSAAAIGPCRQVAEARARLAAQGLDLGT